MVKDCGIVHSVNASNTLIGDWNFPNSCFIWFKYGTVTLINFLQGTLVWSTGRWKGCGNLKSVLIWKSFSNIASHLWQEYHRGLEYPMHWLKLQPKIQWHMEPCLVELQSWSEEELGNVVWLWNDDIKILWEIKIVTQEIKIYLRNSSSSAKTSCIP